MKCGKQERFLQSHTLIYRRGEIEQRMPQRDKKFLLNNTLNSELKFSPITQKYPCLLTSTGILNY